MAAPLKDVPSQFEEGRQAFSRLVECLLKQNDWTYSDLALVAKTICGCSLLHESQISGFRRGSLERPSPMPIWCLGAINEACFDGRCDGKALLGKKGCPLKGADLFEIFCGVQPFAEPGLILSQSDAEAIATRLGKVMRQVLAAQGDIIEELPKLTALLPVEQRILFRKVALAEECLAASELETYLPSLLDALTTYTSNDWSLGRLLVCASEAQ
jgi:hypothetical protein